MELLLLNYCFNNFKNYLLHYIDIYECMYVYIFTIICDNKFLLTYLFFSFNLLTTNFPYMVIRHYLLINKVGISGY